MTVRWMIPNSSSGAGVADDAILRGREYGRGMSWRGGGWGDRLGFGHVESARWKGLRSIQVPGSGALGRGLGRRTSPGCASTAGALECRSLPRRADGRGGCQAWGTGTFEGRV